MAFNGMLQIYIRHTKCTNIIVAVNVTTSAQKILKPVKINVAPNTTRRLYTSDKMASVHIVKYCSKKT